MAELVKAKIDCEEFRPSLELEQFILEGGATDYLEQVKSCKNPVKEMLTGGRSGDWLRHTFATFVASDLPSICRQLWPQTEAL